MESVNIKKSVIWGLSGAMLLIFIFGSFFTVDTREIGIVKRFGEIQGEYTEGLHLKMPILDDVVYINIQEQRNSEEMSAASEEQMPIKVIVSVNWAVDKAAISDIYRKYGSLKQFESRVLDPKLRSSSKAAIAMFKVEQLIRDRNLAQAKIEEFLLKEVEGLPITVSGIEIEEYLPPPVYLQAVLTKQKELQLAQAEEHILAKQDFVAKQKTQTANATRESTKAIADGIAYKIKTEAEAEAQAISVIGEAEASAILAKAKALSNNKTLVDYIRATKYKGDVPSSMTILSGDEDLLINIK